MDRRERRSLGEWAVLGLLDEADAHPFALARQLGVDGPLGKILTVRRPLVYRAVERLARDGFIRRRRSEPGRSGPERTVFTVTPLGRDHLDAWLAAPVDHIRDLRLGFLLKIALLRRSGRPIGPLVEVQRGVLAEAFEALQDLPEPPDEADLWRHHSATAASAFLDDLSGR